VGSPERSASPRFQRAKGVAGWILGGCRNNAAKIYAWLLRANGICRYDLPGLVAAMGEECHPRLSVAEIKDAWKYRKLRWMRDQTISDWLHVSTAESEILEGLPPASGLRGTNDLPPAPMPREVQRRAVMERRGEIQRVIAEVNRVPTVREMSRILQAQGYRGNHQTVFKDYAALGIECEGTRNIQAPESSQITLSILYAGISRQEDRALDDSLLIA
jgi:hypothetical protein